MQFLLNRSAALWLCERIARNISKLNRYVVKWNTIGLLAQRWECSLDEEKTLNNIDRPSTIEMHSHTVKPVWYQACWEALDRNIRLSRLEEKFCSRSNAPLLPCVLDCNCN